MEEVRKVLKRSSMKKKSSRKLFRKTVDQTHMFNKQMGLKRGGIRM